MISQDRKIRPIYGYTLRQLIDTKNTDVCYLYLYLMLMEREDHTVSIADIKDEYGGIEWTPERIDKAIDALIGMGLVSYAFDPDEETGLTENKDELFLIEMVDTLSEVTARISKWVLDGDIQSDARTFEKEEYDDEFYTFEERKKMESENKLLFENITLKLRSDNIFLFPAFSDFSEAIPYRLSESEYGHIFRNAVNIKIIDKEDFPTSSPMYHLFPLTCNKKIAVVYSDEPIIDGVNEPIMKGVEIFRTADGISVYDNQCYYIVGMTVKGLEDMAEMFQIQ